ncbi:MAG: hypothetical protein M1828_000818 [Chrysothrix sp. TS-e1954]|nr:MAG: hypothetical protein M1828_000818 [Chrysothrix sp. TS-e1954]
MALRSPPSLLTLPPSVRATILTYAGLSRPCPVNLTQEKDRCQHLPSPLRSAVRGKPATSPCLPTENGELYYEKLNIDKNDYALAPHGGDNDLSTDGLVAFQRYQRQFFQLDPIQQQAIQCTHSPLQVSILLVCKRLYHEGIDVLYGRNHIVLDCRWPYLNFYLHKLGHRAIAALRTVHITNTAPVRAPSIHDGNFRMKHAEWLDLCRFIGSQMTPYVADMSVSTLAADVETLQQVLNPLRHFPNLRNLAVNAQRGIRFKYDEIDAHHCDTDVAEEQLEGVPDPTKFANLRTEQAQCRTLVRAHVTERTKTNAHALQGVFPFLRLPTEIQQLVLLEAGLKVDRACPPVVKAIASVYGVDDCCGTCLKLPNWAGPSSAFECNCNHWSRQSSSCSCRETPVALFSVSKGMYALALHTFYTFNKFDWDWVMDEWTGLNQRFRNDPPPDVRFLRHWTDEIILEDLGTDRRGVACGTNAASSMRRVKKMFTFSAAWCKPTQMTYDLTLDARHVTYEDARAFMAKVRRLRNKFEFKNVTIHVERQDMTRSYILNDKTQKILKRRR